jgi:hypothetical protein
MVCMPRLPTCRVRMTGRQALQVQLLATARTLAPGLMVTCLGMMKDWSLLRVGSLMTALGDGQC